MNSPPEEDSRVYVVQHERVVPAEDPSQSLGNLGMVVFLTSLSVLFVASLIGYFVIRFQWIRDEKGWPPPGTPDLPSGLWFSTLLLIGCSLAVHLALVGARRDRSGQLRSMLLTTTLLGTLFLGLQAMNWWEFLRQISPEAKIYGALFYFFTGLHAAHVLGGVILLLVVTANAFRGRYWALSHAGVRHTALYWHFLDVVWLILLAVLVLF